MARFAGLSSDKFKMPFGDRVQHRAQVHVRRSPMDEKEIDMVEAKVSEAPVERPAQGIGGELIVPDLGSD